MPAWIDRYRCPTVWNSCPNGTMSVAAMIGRAGPGGVEAVGIPKLEALRTLEEQEMAQGPLAEGHEGQLHPGWVALRLMRHVRPGDVRRRSHGGQQVVDEGPVQHLLGGDAEDHRTPPFHGREVLGRSVSSGSVFRLKAA